MKAFPMDPDLIAGLAKLSKMEHVSMAAIVRRSLRSELEREGILKPPGRVYGPTSRDVGRGSYFDSRRAATKFAKGHPGAQINRSGSQYVVLLREFQWR
jgi:hypothetical protein